MVSHLWGWRENVMLARLLQGWSINIDYTEIINQACNASIPYTIYDDDLSDPLTDEDICEAIDVWKEQSWPVTMDYIGDWRFWLWNKYTHVHLFHSQCKNSD